MIQWVAIITVSLNIISFLLMGLDKYKARSNRRRIPEKQLFLIAIVGGSIGSIIGMRVFRHKTLHGSFKYGLPAILIAQITVVYYVFRTLD